MGEQAILLEKDLYAKVGPHAVHLLVAHARLADWSGDRRPVRYGARDRSWRGATRDRGPDHADAALAGSRETYDSSGPASSHDSMKALDWPLPTMSDLKERV